MVDVLLLDARVHHNTLVHLLWNLRNDIATFLAQVPASTPTSTPASDVVMIPRTALYFLIIGIILIAIPGIFYLRERIVKSSTSLDVAPPIKLPGKNEPFIGGNCPYCGDLIKANSKITVCPDCETPHHQECWDKHGGCTTFGCKSAP